MKKNYKTYEEELGSLKKINFIQDKNILIFKKKKFSYYYDNLIKGIIDYGKPKKTIYIYYSSSSNYLEISKKIEEIIFKENINIFICASYYFLIPSILKKIQNNVYRIRIDGDDAWHFYKYSKWYAQFFDLNITNSITTKKYFKKIGYNSIIYASPFKISYKKNKDKIKRYSVSFVGLLKNKLNRVNYINLIRKNGIKIDVFGADSPSGFVSQNTVFDIYQNSIINLNFTGISFDDNLQTASHRKTTMTGRIFEIIGSGGFLISEYDESIKYFFEPDKDLVVFKNKSDLIKKIKYYLANPDKRKKIAMNGHKKFLRFYEYNKYMPNFVYQISHQREYKTIIDNFSWPNDLRQFLIRFVNNKYIFYPNYFFYSMMLTKKTFLFHKLINYLKKIKN